MGCTQAKEAAAAEGKAADDEDTEPGEFDEEAEEALKQAAEAVQEAARAAQAAQAAAAQAAAAAKAAAKAAADTADAAGPAAAAAASHAATAAKALLKGITLTAEEAAMDFEDEPDTPDSSEADAAGAAAVTTPLEAVLFDIDGTLFNSDAIHLAVFQEVLAEEGFNGGEPISEHFFLQRISGRSNPLIAADLFPEWGEAARAAFVERKEERFRTRAAERLASLMTPGLPALLDKLQAEGVPCAAVTNAPRANAELMLRSIGRLEFFAPLVIGDECRAAKPHPDPYLTAIRALGVAPGACLALEDSPSGVRAAVGAGVRTIGVLSTQSAQVLREAGCALVVHDFEDPRMWEELSGWGVLQ